jgi:3,4-dihydroxy 2-butanone 4-phosphate synthase/GTP cyclohydrolase II
MKQFMLMSGKLNSDSQTLHSKPINTGSHQNDFRSYGIGAQILKDLHVGKMKLLASSARVPSLSGYKLEITGHLPYSGASS